MEELLRAEEIVVEFAAQQIGVPGQRMAQKDAALDLVAHTGPARVELHVMLVVELAEALVVIEGHPEVADSRPGDVAWAQH